MPAPCALASARRTYGPEISSVSTPRPIASARSMSWPAVHCRPGFPATEIDGEYYWDGGVVSNTPLQWVLEARPQPGHARLPGRPVERARGAAARSRATPKCGEKEIRFSSRTRAMTDQYKNAQKAAHSRRRSSSSSFPTSCEIVRKRKILAQQADEKVCNIVHLIYRSQKLRRHF